MTAPGHERAAVLPEAPAIAANLAPVSPKLLAVAPQIVMPERGGMAPLGGGWARVARLGRERWRGAEQGAGGDEETQQAASRHGALRMRVSQ